MAPRWKFEAIPGVFRDLSQEQHGHEGGKVTTQPSHALVRRSYPSDSDDLSLDQRPWPRFSAYVASLNHDAPKGVSYKVLYLTRHGMGFHNQKHAEVGTEAWESKWSLMDGYGDEVWFDAHLTEAGIQQARDLSAFYKDLFANQGAPLPTTLYTSPLTRCLQTTQHVFSPLVDPFRPLIKEDLRERWTTHTCDKRRTRSWIAEHWPGYDIEGGFEEEDGLGKTARPETDEEHRARKQGALEDIWERDDGSVLSLTIHSYAIRSLQEVVGAETFRVREGSSIALLVKGTRLGQSQSQ